MVLEGSALVGPTAAERSGLPGAARPVPGPSVQAADLLDESAMFLGLAASRFATGSAEGAPGSEAAAGGRGDAAPAPTLAAGGSSQQGEAAQLRAELSRAVAAAEAWKQLHEDLVEAVEKHQQEMSSKRART